MGLKNDLHVRQVKNAREQQKLREEARELELALWALSEEGRKARERQTRAVEVAAP